LIGGFGGPQEADAALFVKGQMTKPVIGYVGASPHQGRPMGHAGAIISAFGDTAAEKAEDHASAGLIVARAPPSSGPRSCRRSASSRRGPDGAAGARAVGRPWSCHAAVPGPVEEQVAREFDAGETRTTGR